MTNVGKGYTGRNIYILSNSQAVIKALDSFQINSKLFWDGCQSLMKLSEQKKIQMVWVLKYFFKNFVQKTGELFNLSRDQLSILTGLLSGHCHFKGHPFKLRLVNSPQCDRCKQASKMATHVFVSERLWPHWDLSTWFIIFWKEVIQKTSLSARYCTLFKVWDYWMNELKECTKNW